MKVLYPLVGLVVVAVVLAFCHAVGSLMIRMGMEFNGLPPLFAGAVASGCVAIYGTLIYKFLEGLGSVVVTTITAGHEARVKARAAELDAIEAELDAELLKRRADK